MEKKIAVLSDAAGAPAALSAAHFVIVYERGEIDWQEIFRFALPGYVSDQTVDHAPDHVPDHVPDTPKELRLLGELLADELGEVKLILGSEISGTSFSALNRVGFLICEAQGISDEIFDELFSELEADKDVKTVEQAKSKGESSCTVPEKTLSSPQPSALPGHYFVNLKEIQQCNPLLSTKKILCPFLKDTPFVELVMLCDHQPPWLETDLKGLGLDMKSRIIDSNTLMLTVTHMSCKSDQR